MAFGTFDGLHKGHIDFFKQSRGLVSDPFLIVSIARDLNVKKIKGDLPLFNENKRMKIVGRNKLVDKVVLGAKVNYLSHILQEKPDIIALGYDQKHYVRNLKNNLLKFGLKVRVVRLQPFKPEIYKNKLIKLRRLKSQE